MCKYSFRRAMQVCSGEDWIFSIFQVQNQRRNKTLRRSTLLAQQTQTCPNIQSLAAFKVKGHIKFLFDADTILSTDMTFEETRDILHYTLHDAQWSRAATVSRFTTKIYLQPTLSTINAFAHLIIFFKLHFLLKLQLYCFLFTVSLLLCLPLCPRHTCAAVGIRIGPWYITRKAQIVMARRQRSSNV